jgi:guanyl-specific ribonuclease Sa
MPLLPEMPDGHYTEYDIIDTPNWSDPGRGPERIIVGQQGEIYYTPDHYSTVQKVD